MTPEQMKARDEAARELFPCNPPCDKFGVCSACSDALVYRVGYNAGHSSRNEEVNALQRQLDSTLVYVREMARDGSDPGEVDDKAKEFVDMVWFARRILELIPRAASQGERGE